VRFRLTCVATDDERSVQTFYYDNSTGLLHDCEGSPVGAPRPDLTDYTPSFKTDQSRVPIRKHDTPRILKIQMGLSCNYSCSYCLQKYVPHADDTASAKVDALILKIRTYLKGEPENIQLWGGEPLVYIKTLKPLVAKLKPLYPNSKFSIITNGSLLNVETNDWLIENNIRVSISHDGPGQKFRGPDPLDNDKQAAAILDLYRRKKAAGDPVTIGAMLHAENANRSEIARWLSEKFEDPDILIGEGAIIEVYDRDGKDISPKAREQHLNLRAISLHNIRGQADGAFMVSRMRMGEWLDTMQHGRMLDSIGMKCGMDQQDTLTIDLLGNVLTCQNVSNVAQAPNGENHNGGNIANIDLVEIKTSVHFMNRAHCHGCPVVQVCKGGCMYLTGDLFYSSCNNTYTDNIPFFAASVEALTGYLPVYVEDEDGRLPEDRKDIFGRGKPVAVLAES
jgi:uncharacterized protein